MPPKWWGDNEGSSGAVYLDPGPGWIRKVIASVSMIINSSPPRIAVTCAEIRIPR